MIFKFFRKKRDVEERFSNLHDSLNDSFSKIKDDMQGVGDWIKHLNETKHNHHEKIEDIHTRLRVVEEFMYNFLEQSPIEEVSKQLSKQEQTAVRLNQTEGLSKQLSKQRTDIKTDLERALYSLTAMERAVVWSLLNTDLKLNYEDLSRILGKDRSTVRGQVNNIKRKIPELILEKSESDNSKRFFIDDEFKREIMIKYVGRDKNKKKVRVKN